MNAGAAGVSYWSLLDQYYAFTDSYGSMQQLGLWRSAKREYEGEPYYNNIECDFELRPQYWAYSLLTRHIGRAEIFPLATGDEFIAASAFRNERGGWVYVVANGSEQDFKATIENDAIQKSKFSRYAYTKENLPAGDSLIVSDEQTKARKGLLPISVAAQSIAVYVEE
jgi:alpha-galactosidase